MQVREFAIASALLSPDYKAFLGHFPYSGGIFPNRERFLTFTVLRNPLERLLSAYYFNKHKNDSHHFGTELSIEQWLDSGDAVRASHIFVSFLSGKVEYSMEKFPPAENATLALENLKTFDIVGELSRVDLFSQRLSDRLGAPLNVVHQNKSPIGQYPSFSEQPAHIRRKVKSLCELDLTVYVGAQELMA